MIQRTAEYYEGIGRRMTIEEFAIELTSDVRLAKPGEDPTAMVVAALQAVRRMPPGWGSELRGKTRERFHER